MLFGNRNRHANQQINKRRESRRRKLARLVSQRPRIENLEDRRLLASVDIAGDVLTFNNNGIEQNDLTISLDASGNLVLTEQNNAITPGAGVNDMSADPQTVVIPAADFAQIDTVRINTHSGDDVLSIDNPTA